MNVFRRILGSWYDVPTVKLIVDLVFIILPTAFAIRTFVFGFYQVPSGSMEHTLLVGERFLGDKLTYWFRKPQRGEIIAFDEPIYKYSKNKLVNLWQRYASLNVSNWTKRVIGIPGDHIKGIIENGKPVVYLNGEKLDESAYVNSYPLITVQTNLRNQSAGSFWNKLNKNISGRPERDYDLRSYDPTKPFDQQPFYQINPENLVRYKNGNFVDLIMSGTPKPHDVFEFKLGPDQYWVMGDNRLDSSDSRSWKILDGKLIHGRIIFRIWSMDSEYKWLVADLLFNPISFWKKVRWSRCFQFVK